MSTKKIVTMSMVCSCSLAIVYSCLAASGSILQDTNQASVLGARALANCIGCPSVCGSGAGVPDCSGEYSCPTADWFCGSQGGNNPACKNQNDPKGPDDLCVPDGGSIEGVCINNGQQYLCWEEYQCECSSWAWDECNCGPYMIKQHKITWLDGC